MIEDQNAAPMLFFAFKTYMIRLRVKEGPNAHDQFCSVHSIHS